MSRFTDRDRGIFAVLLLTVVAVGVLAALGLFAWSLTVLAISISCVGVLVRIQHVAARAERQAREASATAARKSARNAAGDARAIRADIATLRDAISSANVPQHLRAQATPGPQAPAPVADVARSARGQEPKPPSVVAEPRSKAHGTAASPYRGRPGHTFWKSAISGRDVADLQGMYTKKFDIDPSSVVATAGSCFAQHISRYLRAAGYRVLDAEPGPQNVDSGLLREHGYGVYSARYGNIYFVRQLLQLAEEALSLRTPQDIVWQRGDRWFDALRPAVQPGGLDNPQQVMRQREEHLRAVRRVLTESDVFVFTMGLTEGWEHTSSGTVYPTAPGTIAGSYDPEVYRFHNFNVAEVVADFTAFRSLALSVNPGLKFLLTVSPVPLAATATDDNVLVATIHSKATLRAAAGALALEFDDVDYFPSYEIVTSHAPGNTPFDETGRNVRPETVETVMSYFLAEHVPVGQPMSKTSLSRAQLQSHERAESPSRTMNPYEATDERVFCEEAVLEAFADEN